MFGSIAMKHFKTLGLLVLELNKTTPKPNSLFKMMTVTGSGGVIGLTNNLKKMAFSSPPVNKDVSKANNAENIVWVDMEMTGLDIAKDHVLEVACLVTDSQLNIIAEGPDLTIYQTKEVLENMNEWSIKQHGESGLTFNCQKSKISLKEAEKQLLDFVRLWTPFKTCPLGGNTIYMDRFFLMKHMPEFEQHMHYRIIDVSTIKELCRRWYPETYGEAPNKKENSKHRALDDIKASIEELRFYQNKIFRKAEVGEPMGMSWC